VLAAGGAALYALQQRRPLKSPWRCCIGTVKTTDRDGRTVAEVVSDININLALVEDGQALAYRQYLGGCDAKAYLDAEFRASRSRRYRCKEIGSHAQAQHLLAQGHRYLDGDGDGQACEALR